MKENIWNQNTIYPQAIIVIDLNNVKFLNDTMVMMKEINKLKQH